MFVRGQVYRRRDLHHRSKFGGQQQGGISTPANHNVILLFTGKQDEQDGYSDGWTAEGVFLYTGEGQRGDMEFNRGNRALLEHTDNRKDVHLFAYTQQQGFVQYEGQMVCSGYHYHPALDVENNARRTIVFELTPISAFEESPVPTAEVMTSTVTAGNLFHLEDNPEDDLVYASLEGLRQKALASSTMGAGTAERKALVQLRSRAIKLYVLKRANGVCEGCNE